MFILFHTHMMMLDGKKQLINITMEVDELLHLFFYIKLLARTAVRKGIKQMRGKEIPEYVEFERKVNQSVIFVRELAIHNKMKPKSTLFSLMQAA